MKTMCKKKTAYVFARYFGLSLLLIWTLFPFYWTLVTSLKQSSQIIQKPITYLPNPITFNNYILAWSRAGFSRYFSNSIFVSLVSMVLTVICSLMCGYALARYRFKFKSTFIIILLSTQFIPSAMIITPLFLNFKQLNLINSHWSIIFTYTVFHVPFNATLMNVFIRGISETLEEAAKIDGCTGLQAFVYVLLPVLFPGVASVSAYAFISSWNEFLFALMFITSSKKYTIPVGLSMTIGEYSINYGQLAAGSIIALLPVILLFAYIQKHMVSGLSMGAIKG